MSELSETLERVRQAVWAGDAAEAERLILQLQDEETERQRREHDEVDRTLFDALEPGGCPMCRPFACDDPDNHLGVPERYTPLRNRGCTCGADFDGRDCLCFEDY